jgi:hypothetical protein
MLSYPSLSNTYNDIPYILKSYWKEEYCTKWFDYILNNLNLCWDWRELSIHPNITWNIVKNNINLPWSWRWLSRNPIVTWDIVKNNPNKQWSYELLSLNPNITIDIINSNPNKEWIQPNNESIFDSNEEYLTLMIEDDYIYYESDVDRHYNWEIVQEAIDRRFDWDSYSSNPLSGKYFTFINNKWIAYNIIKKYTNIDIANKILL